MLIYTHEKLGKPVRVDEPKTLLCKVNERGAISLDLYENGALIEQSFREPGKAIDFLEKFQEFLSSAGGITDPCQAAAHPPEYPRAQGRVV